MLAVIWWMYSGYAWLTNAVAPSSTTRRTLLLTGMAGFLVIALAIPHAFGAGGWVFGVGYLVVNLVHSALFAHAEDQSSVRAIRQLAPLNLVSAGFVLVGGFLPGAARYALWTGAVVVQIVTPYLHRLSWHRISAGHFVERHGLVVLIAIGESVVAIGVGVAGPPVDLDTVTVAILGLCIAYYLWWFYFAGDDERAERVLAHTADPFRRARLALQAWGFAHVPILLGVVVLAVGVHKVVGHAFVPLHWGDALALSGGVAVYLLGHAWFLAQLGLRGVWHRIAAAALVLATIPLGHVIAVAQLAAVPLILAVVAISEDIPELRRTGRTEISSFGRTPGPQ
jgi:low temperature requirement protein LtrA